MTNSATTKTSVQTGKSVPAAAEGKTKNADELELTPAMNEIMRTQYGTDDFHFLGTLLYSAHLSNAGEEAVSDFPLTVLKNARPKNHLERMLVVQACNTHNLISKLEGQLAASGAGLLHNFSVAGPALIKLKRLFIEPLDGLKRQAPTLSVQNISVGEGGQAAVVGAIHQNSSSKSQREDAPPLAIADCKTEPMPILANAKQPAEARVASTSAAGLSDIQTAKKSARRIEEASNGK